MTNGGSGLVNGEREKVEEGERERVDRGEKKKDIVKSGLLLEYSKKRKIGNRHADDIIDDDGSSRTKKRREKLAFIQ